MSEQPYFSTSGVHLRPADNTVTAGGTTTTQSAGGGYSVTPPPISTTGVTSSDNLFANDPYANISTNELFASSPSSSTPQLSLRGGTQLDTWTTFTPTTGDTGSDKWKVFTDAEINSRYSGVLNNSLERAKYEEQGVKFVNNNDGTHSLNSVSKADEIYATSVAAKAAGQSDAQITAGASIKGAYIVATTALASILAQIWMNKQTQDRNDELWQKTVDENRAQMMYNRTGSWTGETPTGGGGGGGAGTGPKLTGIKGYV